jgi:hypothetical protein
MAKAPIWTKHTSFSSGSAKILGNRCAHANSSQTFYHASEDPINADYDVEVDYYMVADEDSEAWFAGRVDTSENTMYRITHRAAGQDMWRLKRLVAGSGTTLASWSESISVSETRSVKLEMRGTAIKGYINGTERLSATDANITAKGKAGLGFRYNTGTAPAFRFNDFLCTNSDSSEFQWDTFKNSDEVLLENHTDQAAVNVSPAAQSVALGIPAIAVKTGIKLTPSVQSIAVSIQTPTVKTGIKLTPSVQVVTISIPTPSVSGTTTITPSVQSIAVSIQTPIVKTGIKLTPSVQSIAVSIQTPTVNLHQVVRPSAQSVAISVLAPQVVVPLSATQLRDRPRAEPVYLVEIELKNGGPTLYISDRNIVMTTQRYENYLDDLSDLNSFSVLKFRNDRYKTYDYLIEIGDTYPFEGATVTVKECYLDGNDSSSAVVIFKGALEEPRDIDRMGFTCKVSPMEYVKDMQWKQEVIDTVSYPNAHEDLGEVEPIIYGDDVLVPALRVDWGARSTLRLAVSASFTTSLSVSDTSRFPSSGDVWVDDERISYTSKSGVALSGLTRGAGGTSATAHRKGADVVEAKSQYDSLLAKHALHSVPLGSSGKIYAEIRGKFHKVITGVSAVMSEGKHILRATDHVRVEALKDDVAVSDNISITVGGSSKTIYPDGLEPNPAPGSHDIEDSGSGYDGNEATSCKINPNKTTNGKLQLGFPDTNYGTITTQYIFARLLGNTSIGGGWAPSSVNAASAGWFRFSKAAGSWGDYVSFANINTGQTTHVYDVRKEVEHTANTNKTGAAYRSGGLYATHTVDRFHAGVSGCKDPDGNYGGTGNLIERPDYVIKHFLVKQMGFSLADIDNTSFNNAGSNFSTAGYTFAFRIDGKVKPSEFLRRMARQCRSTIIYKAGKWHLDYLPDAAPSAVKKISQGDLAGEFSKFKFLKTPVDELSNDLFARFRRNYSRLGSDSEWDATVKQSDSASQAKYGLYPGDLDFDLIRDASMAADVLSHMLVRRKAPRLTVGFSIFYEHFDLEPSDTIEIETPLYDGKKFLIETIRRLDKFRAEVRAAQWW